MLVRVVQRAPAFSNVCRRRLISTSGPAKSFPKEHGLLPSTQSPIVSSLKFFNSVTVDGGQIPTYRVLDGTGQPIEGASLPEEVRAFPFAQEGWSDNGED